MKTLDEHNGEIEERERRKRAAGVACPKCKTVEMEYSDGHLLDMGKPPLRDRPVRCPECGHTGHKKQEHTEPMAFNWPVHPPTWPDTHKYRHEITC